MRNVARGWIGWMLVALFTVGAGVAHADLPTLVRKKVPPSAKKPPTMNGLARLVTNLEDELKKYGTITVKSPDVWGETTLMSMIQEYERYMRDDAANFQPGMQGFIARADQAALSAQMAMGVAAGEGAAGATSSQSGSGESQKTEIKFELGDGAFVEAPGTPFDLLPTKGVELSLEPTEQTREHSVYLKVNQALRRTNLGDDNSRQPGYTSYVLRFPVSVLPGRLTHKGCAAVITIRAQLEFGPEHLHDTFPRLAISDLAGSATPWLYCQWDAAIPEAPTDTENKFMDQRGGGGRVGVATQAFDLHTFKVLYGEEVLRRLVTLAKVQLGAEKPKTPDIEEFVFQFLMQTQGSLERQGIYHHFSSEVVRLSDAMGRHCLEEVRQIRLGTIARLLAIYSGASGECPGAVPCDTSCEAEDQAALSWLLLAQSAVLDLNIRRLVKSNCQCADEVHFFLPDGDEYGQAAACWKELVERMFPVHVFTLDPVVEQQNYFDAFSRRRELQLAMAMAVAKGEMRPAAAVRFTRQLSMDMLAVGLNRTAVAFAHEDDTFGWYFYPRLQSPPEESSNVAALARMIWSTGPTRRYDLCNRQLEPGMRECEAVIVMPAFVPRLKIDITTNWERLVKPGAIKVDYVKMINEAAKIQQAMYYASGVNDQECYRAEDYDILCSRVEQLEKMLPLQRQSVRLPFPFVLSGAELFDNGNKELPPVLTEYYGIEWLQAASKDNPCKSPGPICYNSTAPCGKRPTPSASPGNDDDGAGEDASEAPTVTQDTPHVNDRMSRARRRLQAEAATPTYYETPVAHLVKDGDSPAAGSQAHQEPSELPDEIYFFLKGRHFHPTQTHVVAGGVHADSLDVSPPAPEQSEGAAGGNPSNGTEETTHYQQRPTQHLTAYADPPKKESPAPAKKGATPAPSIKVSGRGTNKNVPFVADVVVLSRELLQVKLMNVTGAHTCDCVHLYVATPAGVSNAMKIPLTQCAKATCARYPEDAKATVSPRQSFKNWPPCNDDSSASPEPILAPPPEGYDNGAALKQPPRPLAAQHSRPIKRTLPSSPHAMSTVVVRRPVSVPPVIRASAEAASTLRPNIPPRSQKPARGAASRPTYR